MKITTTFHKKVPGPEEYSSLGYHLTLEAEPPPEVQQDRDKLRSYVAELFDECRARVEEELHEMRERSVTQSVRSSAQVRRNGRHSGNGRNNVRQAGRNGSTASPKQVNFLRSLANANGLGYGGLEAIAQETFAKDVRDLTVREASQLIDELRT